jgi:hypothetical protein
MRSKRDEMNGWRPATPPKDYAEYLSHQAQQDKRRELNEWLGVVLASLVLGVLFGWMLS